MPPMITELPAVNPSPCTNSVAKPKHIRNMPLAHPCLFFTTAFANERCAPAQYNPITISAISQTFKI